VIFREGFHCQSQVIFVCDVIAPEHRSRFVSADFHCDVLRDARANHVADGRAAQIVEEASSDSRLPTGRSPRLAKLGYGRPVSVEYQGGQHAICEPGLLASFNQRRQLAINDKRSGAAHEAAVREVEELYGRLFPNENLLEGDVQA
jgi:hypothetical protein